ncbi:hypothetical protein F5Y04DRAFT_18084 [Hypomontagnella monticulosa]|nr:hypothetical protein F5Y04DRAFT_18084 [Hypomontagnella monticulosa]
MASLTANSSALRLTIARALPTTQRHPVPAMRILRAGLCPSSSSPAPHTLFNRPSQRNIHSGLQEDRSKTKIIGTHYFNNSIQRKSKLLIPTMDSGTPTPTHHVIVALETYFVPVPPLDLPPGHTYELREYSRTWPGEVAERIKDADIIIVTVATVSASDLSVEVSPHLKMVAVVASGTDCVDLDACKARGIVVTNTPHCNAVSVAEHTTALYFAARRSVVLAHNLVQANEWKKGAMQKVLDAPDGNPPKTCREETLGIVGYGSVGKAIESVAKGLGMKVLISGRKGVSTAPEGRIPFDTLIRESSVIVLCLPRSPATMNLISEAELNVMKPYAVLLNVSRGGIVNEKALLAALKSRRIAGYATDVYEQEPATLENSCLVGPETAGLNLITTPHVAWCATHTNAKYNKALIDNIGGWLRNGQPKYPVI